MIFQYSCKTLNSYLVALLGLSFDHFDSQTKQFAEALLCDGDQTVEGS